MKTVDVYGIDDEILIEMADYLRIAKVDALISEPGPAMNASSHGLKLGSINRPWTIADNLIAAA